MSMKSTEEGLSMDITTAPVFVNTGTRSLMYEVEKWLTNQSQWILGLLNVETWIKNGIIIRRNTK